MDIAEGIQDQSIAPAATSDALQDAGQEKMLKQSEVNELIGRIKHGAYAKGLRESQQQSQPQNGSGLGGMPQLNEEQVRQLIADESSKQAHVAAAHNMLSSFVQQMK